MSNDGGIGTDRHWFIIRTPRQMAFNNTVIDMTQQTHQNVMQT